MSTQLMKTGVNGPNETESVQAGLVEEGPDGRRLIVGNEGAVSDYIPVQSRPEFHSWQVS